jgi:hypothetical protein
VIYNQLANPGAAPKWLNRSIAMSKPHNTQAIPASSLQYRPRDYFARYDLQADLLTKVKGRARRELIKQSLENGDLEDLPDFVTDVALGKIDRQMIGLIHPMFLGGEYLPKTKPGEVEIARINLNSTTYDVAVIYARRVGQRIHYRMVDEYDGEWLKTKNTRTSTKPLTMGEMVSFFIYAWDLFNCLESNYQNDVKSMLSFFNGESEFYPYFDSVLRAQVIDRFYEEDEDDEDEDESTDD